MSVSEATTIPADARATRVRWAAAAATLAGLLVGGPLVLRPLLDVQLFTPESTVLALMSALGVLLFAASLLGVHLVYAHAYGLVGRLVVGAIVILALISQLSLLFTFGVVEPGPPLGPITQIAAPLSFLLVSILGIVLWLVRANRWAAGLLVVIFPLGLVFGMLRVVPVLIPLTGVVVGLAFIGLGFDLWQRARSPAAPA